MKPLALVLVATGFATHLTALSWAARPVNRPPQISANVAVLKFDPDRELDAYLIDWLKQIDARVEYSPAGRVYHIPRSFTLRVSGLPRALGAEVVREVRRALGGERRVDGALVDGDRAGMHVEAGDE